MSSSTVPFTPHPAFAPPVGGAVEATQNPFQTDSTPSTQGDPPSMIRAFYIDETTKPPRPTVSFDDGTESPISPAIARMTAQCSELWGADTQNKLNFGPGLVGTYEDGQDSYRGVLAVDWLVRVCLPTWLRLVPALTPQADLLANAKPIRTFDDARALRPEVQAACVYARDASTATKTSRRVTETFVYMTWLPAEHVATYAAGPLARGSEVVLGGFQGAVDAAVTAPEDTVRRTASILLDSAVELYAALVKARR